MNKRCFDVIAGYAALGVAAVPMAALYVATRIQMGNPAIFKQERLGLNGEPFTVYKFRTMREAFDEAGNPLPDEQRITKFGQFMRRRGLDELPQIFNVIGGSMSMVGPRPLLDTEATLNAEYRKNILSVKPGIFDPAVTSRVGEKISATQEQVWKLKNDYAVAAYSARKDISIIVEAVPILWGHHPEEKRRFPNPAQDHSS